MGKKKTPYTWIILVLLAIVLLVGTINTIITLINFKKLITPAVLSNPAVNIIRLILSVIGLVIDAVFFMKLYNVTPDVFKWVNISFGFTVFEAVLGLMLSAFLMGLLTVLFTPLIALFLGIVIVLWITFYKHLKKAQREGRMDFS